MINHIAQELSYNQPQHTDTIPTDNLEAHLQQNHPIPQANHSTISIPDDAPEHVTTYHFPTPKKYHNLSMVRLMQMAKNIPFHAGEQIQLHIDGGANCSITNNPTILLCYHNIKPYFMSSASEGNDIKCTAVGYLPWTSPEGTCLFVKTFYSSQAVDTIISPSDVILHHSSNYNSWTQHANLATGNGYISCQGDNCEKIILPLYENNGLWYYNATNFKDYVPLSTVSQSQHQNHTALITRLTLERLYELYHARLGHPGQKVMAIAHQHVDGMPQITRPPMCQCHACVLAKVTKRAVNTNPDTKSRRQPSTSSYNAPQTTETPSPGTHFHMDMGFIRGSNFQHKDTDGNMVTSLDGYNSYLLIIDRATRYMWVFQSKYKTPKIDTIKGFLQTHGAQGHQQKYVRTDEGGELWGSFQFQDLMKQMGYILQPTASDASFQNGMAERPNRTLGDMMRSLLYGANLGPQYWSWALLHSVYLKNRLPHMSTGTTPYEAYTGIKPNINKLKVFGCPVIARLPGKHPAKLDVHAAMGIFLGFTATDHNIYYQDIATKKIKIATHVTFDEAGYTIPPSDLSQTQHRLQLCHLKQVDHTASTKATDNEIEAVQHLHTTDQGKKGCGHYDNLHPAILNVKDTPSNIITEDGLKPYDIWLSLDPFEKRLTIKILLKGTHPTLGMVLHPTQNKHRVQLVDILKGTPAHKLPRRRSTIRKGILLSINGKTVARLDDITMFIQQARTDNLPYISCEFATLQYQPLHLHEGSSMLYYDQLSVIARHLTQHKPQPITRAIKDNTELQHSLQPDITDDTILQQDLGKTFKLKEHKQRLDWNKWHLARFKMLNDYQSQDIFSEPMVEPAGANVHHMMWRYTIKMCGTRKARMVCDGSTRRGTITLGHTFANSLDAASERLFWAITAQKGLVAYGADCSNAFAEAPPPQHPLYLRIEEAFREWWVHHLKRSPIPENHTVVRVKHAIQGHPESPRLWEQLMDKILRDTGLQPTRHEPCLYQGYINNNYTLFLRQVDDFAIAVPNEETAAYVIKQINEKLNLPIHIMGKVTRFNGIDIEQTRHYVKITCQTYIQKLHQAHTWIPPTQTHQPLPFPSDKASLAQLLQGETPATTGGCRHTGTKNGHQVSTCHGRSFIPNG